MIVEETLDVNLFYQKVSEFKKFTQKRIEEINREVA